MSTIVLSNFTGIFPRQSDTGLPDNAGQVARNVKLQSGEIRPWRRPVRVQKALQKGVQSIFKMDGSGGATLWCEWTDDTDVCYGPIADQEEFRVYYSEGGVCKKTNWQLASKGEGVAPRDWYYMGTPYPESAPTVKANRVPNNKEEWEQKYPGKPYEEFSADNTENRVYAYTYVSEFGSVVEESAPSEAAKVTCDVVGGSVDISGFVDPPQEHLNVTRIRLYRAVTGASAVIYKLVDELPLVDHKFPQSGTSLNAVRWSEGKYPDKAPVARLGKELDSLYFTPPPEGMKGLVSMPNGFLAGFVHNQVWFSEPYLPHAWPSVYMLTTDSPIIGLGVYGNTLVVTTTRQPYTISGTHPSAMAQEKQPMMQPCVSKRSIAYDQYGVLYASPYGLVAIAGGQMDVFTREIITQDEWQEYNPTTMTGVMYNNLYMDSYRKADKNRMLVFSRGDQPALVEYSFTPTAMHVERGTGRLFCLNEEDNYIYQMDADPINRELYEWTSKRFVNPYWTSFSAMKLDADFGTNEDVKAWELYRQQAIDYNKGIWEQQKGKSLLGEMNAVVMNTFEVNGSLMRSLPIKAEFRYVTVTLTADGQQIYSKTFNSIMACRIPAVKAYSWEVSFSGTMYVRSFAMATTMRELSSPN